MSKVDDIKKELLALGFDVDRIGIIYWVDAIKYVRANYLDWKMCNIYRELAKKYNSTITSVERNMHNTLKPATENIQKKYGYHQPIKNQTFLNLIKFELI